jgi:regulatory protein
MSAYLQALRMLARRELSESQVRQRLARHGQEAAAIDAAVARLKQERRLDDARAAEAIVRTQVSVKRRGRLRVRRELEHAGIAAGDARRALDEVFGSIDEDALLQAALARRLRGRTTIADAGEFQRLARYLAAQGFDADRITAALRARARRHESP